MASTTPRRPRKDSLDSVASNDDPDPAIHVHDASPRLPVSRGAGREGPLNTSLQQTHSYSSPKKSTQKTLIWRSSPTKTPSRGSPASLRNGGMQKAASSRHLINRSSGGLDASLYSCSPTKRRDAMNAHRTAQSTRSINRRSSLDNSLHGFSGHQSTRDTMNAQRNIQSTRCINIRSSLDNSLHGSTAKHTDSMMAPPAMPTHGREGLGISFQNYRKQSMSMRNINRRGSLEGSLHSGSPSKESSMRHLLNRSKSHREGFEDSFKSCPLTRHAPERETGGMSSFGRDSENLDRSSSGRKIQSLHAPRRGSLDDLMIVLDSDDDGSEGSDWRDVDEFASDDEPENERPAIQEGQSLSPNDVKQVEVNVQQQEPKEQHQSDEKKVVRQEEDACPAVPRTQKERAEQQHPLELKKQEHRSESQQTRNPPPTLDVYFEKPHIPAEIHCVIQGVPVGTQ